jgi:hypothetical protein
MSFEQYQAWLLARDRTDVAHHIEHYGAPVVDRNAPTVKP